MDKFSDKKKIIKLAFLNIGIASLNIALFSPGLLNIQLNSSNPLNVSIGGTSIIMSAFILIYGNYKLLTEKEEIAQIKEIMNPDDCLLALKQARGKKIFDNDISIMMEQAESLWKKKEKIRNVLLQKFNVMDTAYKRFDNIINDVEYVFYENVESILNKIYAFDEEDYEQLGNSMNRKKFSSNYIDSKLSIYNEYITYIKNAMQDNEEILIKLDALLLEISNFDCLETGEIDNMNEIRELDEMIKKSKYYK